MCRLSVNTYSIPVGVKLYRYDIQCPPSKWDITFKNAEYVYDGACEELCIKNRIGAFFFFANRATAYNTGYIAAEKNKCNKIWITETSTISKIQLLNFSHFENITSILLSFDELGFDILTEQFQKFNFTGVCKYFSELRPLVNQLRQLIDKPQKSSKDDCDILNLSTRIGDFFYGNDRIDYFGQLLTNFTNGKYFKEMLLSRGYDGYSFRESHDSPTYCILNPAAISDPTHQEIELPS